MKKLLWSLASMMLFSMPALASEHCFLARENGKLIKSEGECSKAYPPQSTFKIALSLIGFDAGILKDETTPSWELPAGVDPYIQVCKGAHTPKTWMRDSCLWYSRILTTQLGMEKFQRYINSFAYGNADLSGGLTQAWISSSLKISPEEQTVFLQKIVDRKLSVSTSSYEDTKNIMFIQELWGGWKLYGKTGNGAQRDANGKQNALQQGWFVGYIEKGQHHIVFASHLLDSETQSSFASLRARNEALVQLWDIIEALEK